MFISKHKDAEEICHKLHLHETEIFCFNKVHIHVNKQKTLLREALMEKKR